jgi:hypothetical protein
MMQTLGLKSIDTFLLNAKNKAVYVGKSLDNTTRIVGKQWL